MAQPFRIKYLVCGCPEIRRYFGRRSRSHSTTDSHRPHRALSPRTLDVVAAAGELLSSRIVAAALTAAGVESEWVDARQAIVTNGDHMRAIPLAEETNAALRFSVLAAIDAGRVPVLGGFVGATKDGHTTTLGRGGSDYSGAIVGAGIG